MDLWDRFLLKSQLKLVFPADILLLKDSWKLVFLLLSFDRYFTALKRAEYNDIDESLQWQAFEWFEKFVNMYTACDTWFEVSCQNYGSFIPCPGDAHLNWKEKGYRTVLDLLQVLILIFSNIFV